MEALLAIENYNSNSDQKDSVLYLSNRSRRAFRQHQISCTTINNLIVQESIEKFDEDFTLEIDFAFSKSPLS
jgi:hypothetical protein